MFFLSSKKNILKSKGYSLVEMLIYIVIMSVIVVVISDVVLTVSKSSKQSFVYNNIKNSAISSLEKIVRETRSSVSIDTDRSTDGMLILNSKNQSGEDKVLKFYIENEILVVDSNEVRFGPLTINGTKVSALNFDYIDTGNSQAVKIKISIRGEKDDFVKVEDFYSTVVLRGSY